ncbi:hypothetical protein CHARACLAT_033587 [Characodon lateralis]|uniref:Uncharacterized protein n=1 Tax=Characodon lateralis TaxID=208331 RepID=A0ABU7DWD8_9TELE|nr:hypothetical protein [Characodon lateralis]
MIWYLPTTLRGPYAHRCTEGPWASAARACARQNPGDIPSLIQAARTLGTQSPQAHPRPAQEQPNHQASNLCPPAQAPQKHCMQPPDAAPESHQSLTPVGTTSPRQSVPGGCV